MAWRRPSLLHSAKIAGAILLICAAVIALAFVLVELAVLSLALLAAVILTALLWPVARWLERWRLPRTLASLCAMVVTLAVVGGAAAWIIPTAVSQVTANRDRLAKNATELLDQLGAYVPGGGDRLASEGRERLGEYLSENSERVASGIAGGLVTATEIITGLLLALVLAFFFLRDGEQLATAALGAISEEKRRVFTPALLSAWKTLRGWIRAAAIIALADAVGIGVGLALVGVPLAFPLAVLTFFGAFIPVVGATIAGAVAILVAWATGGTTDALITLGIVLAVQQLEGNVLEPLVMGRALPLHPAAVLVAVTAGALLGGIPGAFAAVPFAGVTVAFLREVHRRSDPPAAEAEPEQEPPSIQLSH